MTGVKHVLPVRVGPTPLGKFVEHPMLRSGSLLIADMQDLPSTTSLTAEGETIVGNAAFSRAKSLLAPGVSRDLASARLKIWAGTTSAEIRLERTPKRGVHGVVTQGAAGIAPQHGAQLLLPDPVLAYLLANPTHRIGYSLWGRITRTSKAASSGGSRSQYFNVGQISSKATQTGYRQDILSTLIYDGGKFPSPGTYEGEPRGSNSVGDMSNAAFSTTWTGAVPALANTSGALNWGAIGGANNAATELKSAHPSILLYALIIEDLTASGITTAQFQAFNSAAVGAAFGAGGRFADDTFTAPAVLLP